MDDLKLKIREILDFPKTGICFKDITPLFQDSNSFALAINELSKPYLNKQIDVIVGIEARGFLLASPLAYKLGTGLVIARKKGKLPYKKIQKPYNLEYNIDILEMHCDAIIPNQKVLIVDDFLATGGTAKACAELVEELGGKIIGFSFLIEQLSLNGKEKLKGYEINPLIKFN